MKAILRMTVPCGTANAHTAQERYQIVLEQFRTAFPSTILTGPGALCQPGEEIEVKPLELQHFAWLRARRKEWTLHSFSYEEREVRKGAISEMAEETTGERISRLQHGLTEIKDFQDTYLRRRQARGVQTTTDQLMRQYQNVLAEALDVLEALKENEMTEE